MSDIDLKGLSAVLLARSRELVVDLLPGGKFQGNEYQCQAGHRQFNFNVTDGSWTDKAGSAGSNFLSWYASVCGVTTMQAAQAMAEKIGYGPDYVAPAHAVVALEATLTAPPVDVAGPDLSGSVASWTYKTAFGEPVFHVARFQTAKGKIYIPFSYDSANKCWIKKGFPEPRPLYNLDKLTANSDKAVLIVEGEKAAEAADAICGGSYVVTTWANGAAAIGKTDWSPLAGRKVLIWPDADEPGLKAQAKIVDLLDGKCAEIKYIRPDDKAEGWDAGNALAEGWDWNQFFAWAKPRVFTAGAAAMAVAVAKTETATAVAAASASVVVNTDDGEAVGVRETFLSLWEKLGLQTTKGGVVVNVDNCLRALAGRNEFKDLIWYDGFHQKPYTDLDLQTFEKLKEPRVWREVDDLYLLTFFQRHLGMGKLSKEPLQNALTVQSYNNFKNEPVEWLNGLVWDGVPRIEGFFCECFGVDVSAYSQAVSKNFWIAMVARILRPGCQLDNMIILEGDQGTFKSSALRILGGKWSMECRDDVLNKEFNIGLLGKSLVIINEFDKFKKADVAYLKDIISTPVDSFKPLYEKHHKDHPRTCIFIATTNKSVYLSDNTGARRFWPIRTKKINKDKIREIREQCFAEAVHKFKSGESWWDVPSETAQHEQEKRRIPDEWETIIRDWTDTMQEVSIREIAVDCLKISFEKLEKRVSMRIGDCLRFLGWESHNIWRKDDAFPKGRTITIFTRRQDEPDADAIEF